MPMDLAVRCSNESGCVGHHTPDIDGAKAIKDASENLLCVVEQKK